MWEVGAGQRKRKKHDSKINFSDHAIITFF